MESLVGQSGLVVRLKKQVEAIAPFSVAVMIEGPTGAGKEVLARYIHQQSERREKPFIKVDCSALPMGLIESELFGYQKGAFTGAAESKTGRFEQANGGTLFLDEIGNLSLDIQMKLLGVLQDFAVTPVGGSESRKLDIRLISASNIPLQELIQAGRFREDLFHRINTFTMRMPSLAERSADIPLLCRHFLNHFNRQYGRNISDFTPAAYDRLQNHTWPGNVRELRNVVERSFLFCKGEWLDEKNILLSATGEKGGSVSKAGLAPGKEPKRVLMELARDEWVELLKKHRGIVIRVARELKVTRKTCYFHLRRLGIALNEHRK